LEFVASQSYFVVFPRNKAVKTKPSGNSNFPGTTLITAMEGPWKVSFDTKWGGPGKVTFDTLYDWSGSNDDGIRYYSGIATYSKRFVLSELPGSGTNSYLNLGKVHEMARVILNGKDLGVVWCAPWQVDISDALNEGENILEIEVANLWPNRLIGDAALPENDRLTWTIEEHPYKVTDELLPSGLIGPVTLVNVD
jgi:hypothetical protein